VSLWEKLGNLWSWLWRHKNKEEEAGDESVDNNNKDNSLNSRNQEEMSDSNSSFAGADIAPSGPDPPRSDQSGLSRRQKKNRRQGGNRDPASSKGPDGADIDTAQRQKMQKKKTHSISQMYKKLKMTDEEIHDALLPYVHHRGVLRARGYPTESIFIQAKHLFIFNRRR